VSIAEKSFLRRSLAMAQAVVNRVHQTSLRVAQILDVNRSRATRVWKPALYSVAAFSAVCLASLSHAPELVTFEDRTPELTLASATPANEMLTATADSDFVEKQAVATPVIFHAENTTSQTAKKFRFGVAQRSERCGNCPQVNKGFRPEPARMNSSAPPAPVRHEAENNAGLQRLGQGIREGTSSLLPQTAESERGFQPLTANTSPFIEEAAPPQTIMVVMHSEYSQVGPMLWKLYVWQVVVFDASQIPAETRLPAKRI
jgi:hypothetical protein